MRLAGPDVGRKEDAVDDPASPIDPAWRRYVVTALSAAGEEGADGRLCSACARLLDLRGAAIAVVSESDDRGLLCSSNATATTLEDLQVTLGEGPGVDAHRLGVPVTDPDLGASASSPWLVFSGPAVAAGAAAVFAFPLRLGGIRLGTLTFNHDRPGRLSDDRYVEALFVVGVVTQAVLAIQATAPAGTVAAGLEAAADGSAAIHQAAGMLAVRLGVSVAEALVRLRARAYADGCPLALLARDVVFRGGMET